jgi:hypothetical protein
VKKGAAFLERQACVCLSKEGLSFFMVAGWEASFLLAAGLLTSDAQQRIGY